MLSFFGWPISSTRYLHKQSYVIFTSISLSHNFISFISLRLLVKSAYVLPLKQPLLTSHLSVPIVTTGNANAANEALTIG